MDVDYYNSSAETQMDLMALMMEMEKLSELSEQTPSINLSSGPVPPFCNTLLHTPPSPVLSKPPTSPSILGSTAQDTLATPPMASVTMPTQESMAAAMRETVFRTAAMQPVNIDPELVKPRKRRNVRISTDPQSVAARHRRERISERIRILQRLVPGGTKMDTASMLDEAIHYVKFLKNQVQSLERAQSLTSGFPHPASYSYSCHGFVNHR